MAPGAFLRLETIPAQGLNDLAGRQRTQTREIYPAH